MTLMKTRVVLLLLAHGLTQVGISLPDQTWRPWVQHSAPLVALCTLLLFAVRLAADLGLCLGVIGPERRMLAWHAVRAWVMRTQKNSEEIEKTHAT